MIRYRFERFTLVPARRVLLHDGREVPLIPKYFDLLVLLVERRHEAVPRRDILERVWADVVVSDSALSQAVRTIRRALGDDVREPRFIRTVSRHGYRFVHDVVQEADDRGPGSTQWRTAAIGAGVAGLIAGAVGGSVLALAPGSASPLTMVPVLAAVGALAGLLGGAGVGAGRAMAAARSVGGRPWAMVAGTALGGGLAGLLVQGGLHGVLSVVLGLDVAVGGMVEGLLIGAAVGIGWMAVPAHGARWARILPAVAACGLAGLVLTLLARPLVGGTLHAVAHAVDGSRAILAPLGPLIGEPDFGSVTRTVIACAECMAFGIGVSWTPWRHESSVSR